MNIFSVHSFCEVIVNAMSLALKLDIDAYDAAFLSIADKLDIKLLTLDLKLVKKLEKTKYFGLLEFPANKE